MMRAISKIQEKCMTCSNVDKSDMAAPVLMETVKTIVNGQVVNVYKDEIERELYKHLYDGLHCGFIN